ncbi:MAG: glycosyltransferase [Thermoanaerobaculia bacterium]
MEPLRILMVAPQPFFRPRGTPLSILHRVRALNRLGHRVDLLTYPFGSDPALPGLTIRRSARLPLIRDVSIGPSFAKLFLDVPLFAAARRAVRAGDYDLLHTHEEAGILGGFLSQRHGIPHVYDMHSSLPQQFETFGRFAWRPVVAGFERLERFALAHSAGVITVYPRLEDAVRSRGYGGPLVLLENTLELERGPSRPEAVEALQRRLGLTGRHPVVYTGTLEAYQGMDLLVEAGRLLGQRLPAVKVVSVGGTQEQIDRLRRQAERLGAAELFAFVPAVPPGEVFLYHELAEALVTCRTRGTNTPLKLYQYLRSGKPIIATDIPAHTQVLDQEVAELVAPTPEGLALGIERVLSRPDRGREMARRARARHEEHYGETRHLEALRHFLEAVLEAVLGGPAGKGERASRTPAAKSRAASGGEPKRRPAGGAG